MALVPVREGAAILVEHQSQPEAFSRPASACHLCRLDHGRPPPCPGQARSRATAPAARTRSRFGSSTPSSSRHAVGGIDAAGSANTYRGACTGNPGRCPAARDHRARQPGLSGQFPQRRSPGSRHHTLAVRADLDLPRPPLLHLRSAFLSRGLSIIQPFDFPVQARHFFVSQVRVARRRETPGLARHDGARSQATTGVVTACESQRGKLSVCSC
jgi:hypothetical protein